MTKKAAEKELVATKDNQLIQLRGQVLKRSTLSEKQLKLVTYCCSLVRPEDEPFKKYQITIKQFIDLCGISKKGKVYTDVYHEVDRLPHLGINFIAEDGLIKFAKYIVEPEIDRENGVIHFMLSPHLLPYYKQYSGQFTRISLLDYMPLRGRYALLLYELLLSWKSKGHVSYSVEELRRLLDVPEGKYSRNADLMKRVIRPAIEEINEKSVVFRIDCTEQVGSHNKVAGVDFVIHATDKAQLPAIQESLFSAKELTERLLAIGVKKEIAVSLVKTYSPARIVANIKLAESRDCDNLAGMTCTAITEDFAEIDQPDLFS